MPSGQKASNFKGQIMDHSHTAHRKGKQAKEYKDK